MKAGYLALAWMIITVGMPLIMVLGALFKLPHWPSYDLAAMVMSCSRAVLLGMLAKKFLDHKDFQGFLNS